VLCTRRDEVDVSEIWTAKRRGLSTRAALEAAGVDAETSAEIGRSWQSLVEEPVWLQLDQCFVDTQPLLQALQHKGCELALLTARSKPWWLEPQLRRLGLDHYFADVIVVHPTWAAEEKAEKLRKLRPSVFVGDSESDFRAALSSGTKFLAVATGQRDTDFLRRCGVGRVYESLSDLEDAIEADNLDARLSNPSHS
jgi:phosphoglycolate phosphatase-like HAD superfamily hydrolase